MMNMDTAIKYMLLKPGVTVSTPFITPVPVFKVGSKMFATSNIHETRLSLNLKNNKEDNAVLRQAYPVIVPGYHMNKDWWNTVYLEGNLEDDFILKLIDISYLLVFNSLKKSEKSEIYCRRKLIWVSN